MICRLTTRPLGRVAKQPELKFCAVNLEKVNAATPEKVWELPHELVGQAF